MPRFNPIAWNFVAKRINEVYYRQSGDQEEFQSRINTLNALVTHFADHFQKDNPAFDRKKFIDACINFRD